MSYFLKISEKKINLQLGKKRESETRGGIEKGSSASFNEIIIPVPSVCLITCFSQI